MTREQLLTLAEKAGIHFEEGRPGKNELIEILRNRAASDQTPGSGSSAEPGGDPFPAAGEREVPGVKDPPRFPQRYGRTSLTLMEVGPHLVFACWEITPEDRRAAVRDLGAEGIWFLRFHDVTSGRLNEKDARSRFDVPIEPDAENWYVNLWSGAKSYVVEIGPGEPGGRFVPVCRSNRIDVPAAGPSETYHPRWASGPARGEPAAGAGDAPAGNAPGDTERPAPAGPEDAPDRKPASEGASPAASEKVSQESRGRSSSRPEEMVPPSSAGPAGGAGVGSGPFAARAEVVSGGGVFPKEAASSVDIRLNLDLVLYGRAEPGQTIQINGQWIKAGPDGTFRIRTALPIVPD